MEILDDRSVIYQLEVYKKWYEEQQEEIERLNNSINEYQKALDETMSEKMDLEEEIEKLNNIIDELEKDIKEKYNEAHDYQTKIRQSDLQQGEYPVGYYYAERDEKLSVYFLDKLKELKGSDE